MMNDDMSATTVPDAPVRRVRSEAEWLALMAEFESWDGSQVGFCESRGVSVKSFQGWRRRRGLAYLSAMRAIYRQRTPIPTRGAHSPVA